MRAVFVAALLVSSCQPRHTSPPSFFAEKKPDNAVLDCHQIISCYDQCSPRVEECLLRCDQRSSYYPVQRARAVANCAGEYSCTDEACERERCGPVYQACIDPLAPGPAPTAPPPSTPPAP